MKSLIAIVSLLTVNALANEDQLQLGRQALKTMTGCYLIDYSYTETEALKPGYVRDHRVYDVNKNMSFKEWIYAEDLSPTSIRLQHILFATGLDGKVIEASMLKHQAEDWEFNGGFLYDFTSPQQWKVKGITPNLWTRKITNLDDGLRYQCASEWNLTTAYPEWSCDNYAPIPGREIRDMGRKDYNTLERSTRIIAYGNSWLERQTNIKVIHQDQMRTPLAKELGKNWYVRLPDAECASAIAFMQPRLAFWSLLRETWEDVLDGNSDFAEKTIPGAPPRFVRMLEIEEQFFTHNLNDPKTRQIVKREILNAIEAYRSH